MSSLKPNKFHEFLVRVYYDPKNQEDQKDQEDQKEVQQKAEEYFHKWCNDNEKFIDFGTDSGNSNCAAISSLSQIQIQMSFIGMTCTVLPKHCPLHE